MFRLGPNTRLEPRELPAGWPSTTLPFHCSSSHSQPAGTTRLRTASTTMKPRAVENPARTAFTTLELWSRSPTRLCGCGRVRGYEGSWSGGDRSLPSQTDRVASTRVRASGGLIMYKLSRVRAPARRLPAESSRGIWRRYQRSTLPHRLLPGSAWPRSRARVGIRAASIEGFLLPSAS